jgi:hypothetical protein
VIQGHSSTSIGVLLCPMFSYKRGGVWQAEQALVTRLVNRGLNLDKTFSVLFKQKCDQREVLGAQRFLTACWLS